MTDNIPTPAKDRAPTLDVSGWSRERLEAAFHVYRNLYADEAMARRRAVADKIGAEERLAAAEHCLRVAEQEIENLQKHVTMLEYGERVA